MPQTIVNAYPDIGQTFEINKLRHIGLRSLIRAIPEVTKISNPSGFLWLLFASMYFWAFFSYFVIWSFVWCCLTSIFGEISFATDCINGEVRSKNFSNFNFSKITYRKDMPDTALCSESDEEHERDGLLLWMVPIRKVVSSLWTKILLFIIKSSLYILYREDVIFYKNYKN